jgi:hypothetical protein
MNSLEIKNMAFIAAKYLPNLYPQQKTEEE